MECNRWVVFASTFLCQFLFGIAYFAPPRMLVATLETFRTNRVQAGSVSTTLLVIVSGTGIVAGSLVHKFGANATGAASSAIIAIGFCVSIFATSVTYLLVFVGVMAGSGLSMLSISTTQAAYDRFTGSSQTVVVTFVLCGVSFGGMACSYATGLLLDTYGLRGTLLITGGFLLHGPILTLLWPTHRNDKTSSTTTSSRPYQQDENNVTKSLKDSFKKIFKNTAFLLFGIGNSLNMAVVTNVTIYIMDTIAADSDRHSSDSATPFIYTTCILLGRLVCGVLHHLPQLSPLVASILSSLFSSTGCLLLTVVNLSQVRYVAWAFNGFSAGLSLTSAILTTKALVGKSQLSTGMGTVITIEGVGILLGGPLNGYIRDETGSYRSVFLCSTVLLVLSCFILLVARALQKRQTAVYVI